MGRRQLRNFAIVGSGVAGLTCAIRLTHMGLQVRVYEKARGPGGRLAAMRTEDGAVDMGAQFFTIRNERFRHFLTQYAGPGTFQAWKTQLFYEKDEHHREPFHADERYVGTPRMSAVTRALSRHVPIQYGTRIETLKAADQGWWLVDDEAGRHGPFDAVVVTAPPAQTAHILREQVELQEALAGYHLVPCWAAALHYAAPLPLAFGAIQVAHPQMRWIACDSSKPGRDHRGQWWVIHAQPDWSAQNLSLTREAAADLMHQAFRDHFSVTREPLQVLSHRWLFAQPTNPAGPGHLWDDHTNLGVCGDYLDGGRVEGAFNSAESLLAHLRVGNRLSNELIGD